MRSSLNVERMTPDKTTFLPKTFSRNKYVVLIRSIWATNLTQQFPKKSLLDFWPPCLPTGYRKFVFFNFFLLKLTRVVKSTMLIKNIAILKFQSVFLKNRAILICSDVCEGQIRFLNLLSFRKSFEIFHKLFFRCILSRFIRISTNIIEYHFQIICNFFFQLYENDLFEKKISKYNHRIHLTYTN